MSEFDRVESLTLKLIEGPLSEEEQAELDALLDGDETAEAIHFALIEQEAALRSMVPVDLTAKVMDGVRGYGPTEPDWRWLFSKRFWQVTAAAVAIAATILLIVSLERANRQADSQETVVFGQVEAAPGQSAPQRVQVRDGATNTPIRDADVRLALLDPKGSRVWEGAATTDDAGYTFFEPTVPGDAPEGSYTLRVEATASGNSTRVERKLEIHRAFKVMLVTDKPTYQPGQLVHMRTLSRDGTDGVPVADAEIVLEVHDAKGNKVFKKALTTSKYGIAAADFQLADQVVTGDYTVRAVLGDTESERSVIVERYTLPKFSVDMTTHAGFYAPGEVMSGRVSSAYTFGKPVTADVTVVASELVAGWEAFATAQGRTDSEGVYAFELPLKRVFTGMAAGQATVRLEATVTDSAGHIQTTVREVVVATRPLHIEVYPESGNLVRGAPNTLFVLTSYPDGRPAETELEVQGLSGTLRTSASGVAEVEWMPTGDTHVVVKATDSRGLKAKVDAPLTYDDRADTLLLRTDKAIYSAGDTATIDVLAPAGSGVAFIDVVRNRRTVLTRTLQVEATAGEIGRAQLILDLPSDLHGTLEVHAYRLDRTGNVIGDTRKIDVRRSSELTISAQLDRDVYRPGGRARLQIDITDSDGQPVPSALGLSVVDEAVFALEEMNPGLTPTRNFAPTATVYPATPAEASERFVTKQARIAKEKKSWFRDLAGLASLLPGLVYLLLTMPLVIYGGFRGLHRVPLTEGPERDQFARSLWILALWWTASLYLPVFVCTLFACTQLLIPLVIGGIVAALFSATLVGVEVRKIRDNPLSHGVPMLRRLVSVLPFAALIGGFGQVAPLLASQTWRGSLDEGFALVFFVGVPLLVSLVAGALCGVGPSVAGSGLLRWFWVVTSRSALAVSPSLLWFVLVGMVAASFAQYEMVATSTGGGARDNLGSAGGSPPPTTPGVRVRRDFPETLAWIPELITDDLGHISVDIDLADSITDWRASLTAVSGDGSLGGTDEKIRVFQDFFVDIDFPVALTQHDQITVPVAIYNYLEVPQTLRLEAEPAAWYALRGPASKTLRVGPGEVTVASFSIEALKPGEHPFLVRAFGTSLADAVERTVHVKPDGQAVVQTFSGNFEEGVTHEIEIPDDTIDGGSDLFVKVYPGSFSQLVEGLDSVFRMPYGCFEQTSSTTYPNVLVLDYLRQTKQIKPEVELKALEYIGIGYQRLLSFEVRGGGFEWFGRAPANKVLTAYGLMEFSDMSRVYDVDPKMVARTRTWLMGQQESDGSWIPDSQGINEGATGQYLGETLRTTAYIAWALAESAPDGQRDYQMERAWAYIATHVADETDPYTLAVVANALVAGNQPGATQIIEQLDRLKTTEDKLVHWRSSATGVTFSRGDVLNIETTALAAHAYLEGGMGTTTAHPALAWLTTNKDQFGNWHSTQATVHALRALIKGAGSGSEIDRDVDVTINAGGALAETVHITPADADVFRLISLREHVASGTNRVTLETTGGANLAYQIVSTHYVPHPVLLPSATEEDLSIEVDYDKTRLAVDDILQADVRVSWNRPGAANMTMIGLGLPPGFEPVADTFEKLVSNGVIEKFSVTGNQAILYVRRIQNGHRLEFGYQLRAKYPVRAQAPAATAYQYYEPEVRDETAPVDLIIE